MDANEAIGKRVKMAVTVIDNTDGTASVSVT